MPEKEVIVKCYDKSGTLLAMCSAISFDSDVVLMHGFLLAPIIKTELKEWFMNVLIGLQSEIRLNPVIDEKIEFIVHEEDSFLADGSCRPGRRMVSAGMWTCPLLKSTPELDTKEFDVKLIHELKQLFSLFIFLETAHTTNTPNDPILVNSLSRGIVSQVFGRNDCMFLTDAATTSYSSGAPIFLAHNESSETVGKGALMGMTCRVFKVDRMTQGISLLPVLKRLLPPGRALKKYPIAVPRLHDTGGRNNCHHFVQKFSWHWHCHRCCLWHFLTCSHCIPKGTSKIRVLHKSNTYPARLVYKTTVKCSLDFAVIQVSPGSFVAHMELADTPAQIGERVLAAGFPDISMTEGFYVNPFISVGCIAKCNPSSFIITTCFVFPGHSGGAILKNGELLGMITSTMEVNESSSKGKNDFRFGVAIPATFFAPCVKEFIDTKNIKYLKNLESAAKKFPNYWPVVDSKM